MVQVVKDLAHRDPVPVVLVVQVPPASVITNQGFSKLAVFLGDTLKFDSEKRDAYWTGNRCQ